MKDIIIIDHEPLTIRKKQIWHIEELRVRGFHVAFWDISEYVHPGMKIADTLNECYAIRVTTFKQIQSLLSQTNIERTLFIVETPDNWGNRAFFRLLSTNRCFTIRVELYASIYMDHSTIRGWRKLKAAPLSLYWNKVKTLLAYTLLKLYKNLYDVKGYDLQISSHNSPATDISINHPDWENYKYALANPGSRPFEKSYVVFLDEYYPLHPDLRFFTKERRSNANKYRQSMMRFFDIYEQLHDTRVIIAAHPKADYQPEAFGNRPIIKYQTNFLIQHSEGVFIHNSAAVAYAVLFDRPIAFITNDEYRKSKYQSYFQMKMADNFGRPIWNIDRVDIQTVRMEHINSQLREQYIYNTLTAAGQEDKKTADILCEALSCL